MYAICFMTTENKKGILVQNGTPVLFSEEEAWNFINETMSGENHPKFMWVRKVENDNP